MYFSQIITVH